MGRRRAEQVADDPRTELRVVADTVPERATETADRHGVDATTAAGDVVAADVDVVVLSVPNKFHLPLSLDALRSGRHVFCEKPLARTPDEAARVAAAAESSDATLKVGSNFRHFECVDRALELVGEGAVGEPLFFRGWIGNDGSHLDDSWFGDPELAGGGTFLDNGSHMLDLLLRLFGDPTECTGYVARSVHDLPVEDNGFGMFRFEDGETAFLQSSWTEWDEYAYAEVYGTDGSVKVDARLPNSRVVVTDPDGYTETYDYSTRPPASYESEFAAYVDALLAGRAPDPGPEAGLRAVEMAHGVYEAAETGEAVDLSESTATVDAGVVTR